MMVRVARFLCYSTLFAEKKFLGNFTAYSLRIVAVGSYDIHIKSSIVNIVFGLGEHTPFSFWYCPAGQALQLVFCELWQCVCTARQTYVGVCGIHVKLSIADILGEQTPADFWYLPAGQNVHAALPSF